MSDHREQLVDLDTPATAADERVEQVRDWLVESGWALPDGYPDDLYPGQPALAPSPPTLERWPGAGFDSLVVPRGEVFMASDGTAPPRCPACATELPSWDQLMDWVHGEPEPHSTCAQCGWEGPLGDWDLVESVAPGSLAVVIDAGGHTDPRGLARALAAELAEALGGRWAHVHYHA